ncbi:mechanosensitive ion channel family protein [Candidatus Palauibacter sp.]|uniref:mechanosensitive ion channel family protein n=1 Tax=Candidatus Palauibacter sp. TaxID=3101350 RepID=UPI003AF2C651
MGLDQTIYGNALSAWLIAAGIYAATTLSLWLIERYALRAFARFARNTQTSVDDLVADILGETKFGLILFVALFAASLALQLDPTVSLVIRRAAAIAVVVQGGIWASAAIAFWVTRFVDLMAGEDAEAVTMVSALSFVGRLAVWSVVLLLILDNLGVEVAALLAGLGIGGIAVALAAQNVLSDLLASLSIILDKPFVIGDFLVIGEYQGSVERIGLKTTRLRSLGGEQLILGNSDVINTRIRNLGRMADRRASLQVGVTYDTPREVLAQIPGWIEEIVEAQEDSRFDRCHLSGFGESAIEFDTIFYMTVPQYDRFMDTKQAVLLAIHERFDRHGVEFAYPTRVVYTIPADPADSTRGDAPAAEE